MLLQRMSIVKWVLAILNWSETHENVICNWAKPNEKMSV